MSRSRSLVIALAMVAMLFTTINARPAAAAPGTWLSQINGLRGQYGLAPLTEDGPTSAVAQAWTQSMANTGTLAHNPQLAQQLTIPWNGLAENVGYGLSEDSLFQAFVSSPGHRANLLGAYNGVGIGQVVSGGRVWATHVFLATTASLRPPASAADATGRSGSDLFFVKSRNTGRGKVEVHSATSASGYQEGQHSETWLDVADQDNGYFQMVGPDLYFIKTRNTGRGFVEVHSATAASGYQSGIHMESSLSSLDQDNGWFQMVGGDLWFVKTRNTGRGFVEVHSATAASGYQSGIHMESSLGGVDRDNGWFQMVGGDLWFVKTRNTGRGFVEVHSATAVSAYQAGLHTETWLGTGDQGNGWFQVGTR